MNHVCIYEPAENSHNQSFMSSSQSLHQQTWGSWDGTPHEKTILKVLTDVAVFKYIVYVVYALNCEMYLWMFVDSGINLDKYCGIVCF